jgi:hypothetical protein
MGTDIQLHVEMIVKGMVALQPSKTLGRMYRSCGRHRWPTVRK